MRETAPRPAPPEEDDAPAVPPPRLRAGYQRSRIRRPRLGLKPGWPLTALIAGFPLWWVLGLAQFIFIIAAVPMLVHLLRIRRIRVPHGFGLWALFCVWMLVGAVALRLTAPDTLPQSLDFGTLSSYALRAGNYLAATITLLYVGNLTEAQYPRAKLAKLLGYFALVTIAGGLLGTFLPHLEFTSLTEALLPRSISGNRTVAAYIHPAAAQVQDITGEEAGRAKAPFDYTNTWGANLSGLLIWLFAGWWAMGTRTQRWIAIVATAIAAVPIVYSLNRGMWIGLGITVGYVAVRMAARGRFLVLGTLMCGIALAGVIVIVSPLQTIIAERLANPHSDDIRTTLALTSIKDAASSPIIGYGSTRKLMGSSQSIAVGHSASCAQCGNASIGSTGQLWLVLIANGFVGAFLYVGFFVYAVWRYRGDRTPIGLAGSLSVLLPLWYMFTYVTVGSSLVIAFLGLGLLWRNEIAHTEAEAERRRAVRAGHRPTSLATGRWT